MERDPSYRVLTEVWEALERVHPARGHQSLADLGFITATSTDGASVRVLLSVPAAWCRDLANSELLSEVELAISGVPSLRGVHLNLKVHRPTLEPPHDEGAIPARGRDGVQPKTSLDVAVSEATEHPHPHALCLSKAMDGLRYRGWELGGFQQRRFENFLPEKVESTDTVRVIVHAQIESGPNNPHPMTASSVGAP